MSQVTLDGAVCDFLNGRQIEEEAWLGLWGVMDWDMKQPADEMLPPP